VFKIFSEVSSIDSFFFYWVKFELFLASSLVGDFECFSTGHPAQCVLEGALVSEGSAIGGADWCVDHRARSFTENLSSSRLRACVCESTDGDQEDEGEKFHVCIWNNLEL